MSFLPYSPRHFFSAVLLGFAPLGLPTVWATVPSNEEIVTQDIPWNHDTLNVALKESPPLTVIKTLPQEKGVILQLDHGIQAIFKPRKSPQAFYEVLSYEIATQLFGLPHTVPPTVARSFKGEKGIWQYYVQPSFALSDRYFYAIKDANHSSYQDLQTFLFCTGMGDLNEEGIIPWENPQGKINFTYVDSEFLFYETTLLYGKRSPSMMANLNDYNELYPRDVFMSKYTPTFNSSTIEHMKKIDKEKILTVWSQTEEKMGEIFVKEAEETKNAAIDLLIKNVNTILNVQTASK
jgi:hypothetical protein